VGRLTSSMTQLQILARKDAEKFLMLRRYLTKNQTSPVLTMRVMHNAQHALCEQQRFVEESKVELLSLISEPLRVEIHFEFYAPVLAVHPFFRVFIDTCPHQLKKVCHKAMSQLLVSTGDVLFMPGEVPSPPRMMIICTGAFSYHYISGGVAFLQAGQCVSEAVLWLNSWMHQGMLKASGDSRLCLLDAAKFLQIAESFDGEFDLRTYARTYLACMNNGTIEATDLPWDSNADALVEVCQKLSVGAGFTDENDRVSQTSSVVSSNASSGGGERRSVWDKKSVLMSTLGAKRLQ